MTDTDNPPAFSDDVEVFADPTEVPIFSPPIPDRLRPESMSQVVAINGLDLESLDDDLTREEFAVLGAWVQISAAGSPWWEGDWANYGLLRYGDDYYQHMEIEWSDSTMHAKRRVTAGAFPMERRRENLTWEHHELVVAKIRKGADIDMERDAWLKKAEDEGMTVAQLAKAIRDAQAIDVGEAEETPARPDPVSFTTFTLSWTVPVADADAAESVIDRAEGAVKRELEMAGCMVSTTSGRRKG